MIREDYQQWKSAIDKWEADVESCWHRRYMARTAEYEELSPPDPEGRYMTAKELMVALGKLHPDTVVSMSYTTPHGGSDVREIASVVVVDSRLCILSDEVDEL